MEIGNATKQSFSLDAECCTFTGTPLLLPHPLQPWQLHLICFMCWVLGEIYLKRFYLKASGSTALKKIEKLLFWT